MDKKEIVSIPMLVTELFAEQEPLGPEFEAVLHDNLWELVTGPPNTKENAMKKTYESFEELAEAMTMGEGILHADNCAPHRNVDPCFAWQHGVNSFAEWLDHIGVKVEIDDKAENFYDFMASKTPKSPPTRRNKP